MRFRKELAQFPAKCISAKEAWAHARPCLRLYWLLTIAPYPASWQVAIKHRIWSHESVLNTGYKPCGTPFHVAPLIIA